MQRAHAISNGVFVAAVNRVGIEYGDVRGNRVGGDGIEFFGGTFLCDPFGRVLAEASHDQEEILIVPIDLKLIDEVRRNWPFLRDRRIESYPPIAQRFIDGR
jgi:N-carbamoylputrescine amidase